MLRRALQPSATMGGRQHTLRTAGRVVGKVSVAPAGGVAQPPEVSLAHAWSGRGPSSGSAASMAMGSAGSGSVASNSRYPSIEEAESTA
jgi:hypothetical protein